MMLVCKNRDHSVKRPETEEHATDIDDVCAQYQRRIGNQAALIERCLLDLGDSPLSAPLQQAFTAMAAMKRRHVDKRRIWAGPGRHVQSADDFLRRVTAVRSSIAQVDDALLLFARQTQLFRDESERALVELRSELRGLMHWRRRASALLHVLSTPAPAGSAACLRLGENLATRVDTFLHTYAQLEVARQLMFVASRKNLAAATKFFAAQCEDSPAVGSRHAEASQDWETARAELQACLAALHANDQELLVRARRAREHAAAVNRLCGDLAGRGA